MNQYIALDIGIVRTGIATSDPLGLFASPLKTVETKYLLSEMEQLNAGNYAAVIIGLPLNLKGEAHHQAEKTELWVQRIQVKFPELQIIRIDERFTSSLAMSMMIESGRKKTHRQEKGNTDKMAAAIILQTYLDQIKK